MGGLTVRLSPLGPGNPLNVALIISWAVQPGFQAESHHKALRVELDVVFGACSDFFSEVSYRWVSALQHVLDLEQGEQESDDKNERGDDSAQVRPFFLLASYVELGELSPKEVQAFDILAEVMQRASHGRVLG